MRMRRIRAPKRGRREAQAESWAGLLSLGISNRSSAISGPDLAMKVSLLGFPVAGLIRMYLLTEHSNSSVLVILTLRGLRSSHIPNPS